MNKRLLSLAGAAILALAASPSSAQRLPAAAPPVASAAALAGNWLHDDRGRIIGSVKSVSPDGRMATIVFGVYTFDNVRVTEVPAGTLSVVDGLVTLRHDVVEAANAPLAR